MGTLRKYPIPEDLRKVLNNDILGTMSNESMMYMKILSLWSQAKCIDVTQNHYLQLLKMALYIEELQCEMNMQTYDLRNKKIFKTESKLFKISTADEWTDNEDKPRIVRDDIIHVIDIADGISYPMRIVNVNKNSIEASSAKFFETHSEEKLYNVKFNYNNYPMRCRHYALWLAHQRNVSTYLFPKNLKQPAHTAMMNLKLFNSTIKSNTKQVQAILNILRKSSFPYPYILYGPPGTGKTATIVESICQIVAKNRASHVLVCTPSNTAADEVTKRLLDYLKPELVFRLYSRTKDPLTIDEKILPCCNCEKGEITFVKSEEITEKRIVITTLCNCTRLIFLRLRHDHFSHVIIDEAGQSLEPDILIPISLVSGNGKIHSQIVLAGDPKQLGPSVMSKLAGIVLGRSILERLMSNPVYQEMPNGEYNSKFIIKLLISYRSHPNIIKIPNELFYNNELTTRCAENCDEFPVIFYGVFGEEEKHANSTSSYNRKEINIILNLIYHMIQNKQNWGLQNDFQNDIGIVTPFQLQSREIRKELHKRNLYKMNVGTVELFQGQEKKIMIVSTVRTKVFQQREREHIGFLSNPKRFNVAITRAKSKLIVVGNPKVLQVDPSWNYLLKYCMDNKSYYGEEFEFNSLDNGPRSYFLGESENVKSSDLFRWNKFKMFTLDNRDSKADVFETMRITSYPKIKPSQPFLSIIPMRPIEMISMPQVKSSESIQPIEQSISISETKCESPVQPTNPIQSIESVPPTEEPKFVSPSIPSTPIHEEKLVPTTQPITLGTSDQSVPITEIESGNSIQPSQSEPPVQPKPECEESLKPKKKKKKKKNKCCCIQ